METLLVSLVTVTIAEMGDRTQLLSLMLIVRYGRPWPIMAGILVATLANHLAAGALGAAFGQLLSARLLDLIVGASMIGMAAWALLPDRLDEAGASLARRGVFCATMISFFIAEIGDKTQIATAVLGAEYKPLWQVIAGTTCGMLIADVPAVWLGARFAHALPLRATRIVAAALFAALAIWILLK